LFRVRVASAVLLVAAWQAAATLAPSRTLPPPWDVLAFIGAELGSGDMLFHIGATLGRVVVSFSIAMLLGCAIGIALGRRRALDRFFDIWLVLLLNTPALVITVLCYLWLGLTETAAIVAVALNKLPNAAVIVREGARAMEPALDEMSAAFRLSTPTWARHVLLPQMEPYVVAAARSGLALVWKVVLVVELLGRPSGVGYAISYFFQLFDIRAVLGYSIAFSLVMLAIEFLVLMPLEAHARRWRPKAA
jgi:ABC-type nitrate/sulfonate/bicarbonate transport system permease component